MASGKRVDYLAVILYLQLSPFIAMLTGTQDVDITSEHCRMQAVSKPPCDIWYKQEISKSNAGEDYHMIKSG